MLESSLLISAIVALCGTVGAMYRQQMRRLDRIEKKLDDCERDRKQLFERIIAIETSR